MWPKQQLKWGYISLLTVPSVSSKSGFFCMILNTSFGFRDPFTLSWFSFAPLLLQTCDKRVNNDYWRRKTFKWKWPTLPDKQCNSGGGGGGGSFWRNCGATSVGKYKYIILVLSTELIKCWLATLKSFKADVLSIRPSSNELGTQSNVYHIFLSFFPSTNIAKGSEGNFSLFVICYLGVVKLAFCVTLVSKKSINIGSWTVSFMLTLLSYWNTQGVASFHRFHFKLNMPTNFLRKQYL